MTLKLPHLLLQVKPWKITLISIEFFEINESRIEQHSYFHSTSRDSKIKDIAPGIEAHKRLLGTLPVGYRAPRGIITKQELLYLERSGIKFDSSIFQRVFPGRTTE